MKRKISTAGSYSSVVKKTWKFSFILALALMITAGVHAQGGTDEDPDNPVPIDGGISLLVAAGVGYGVKKLREGNKNKAEDSI